MKLTEEDKDKINLWQFKKNLSNSTLKTYKASLKEYCNLLEKTPAQIINEAIDEEKSGMWKLDLSINKRLQKFKQYLTKSTKAESTQALYMYAVISFYSAHAIYIPDITMPQGDLGLEKNHGRLMEKYEIQRMVNIASSREAAFIYLFYLSGLSQKEARNLTIRRFMESAGNSIKVYLETLDDLFKYEKEITEEILQLDIIRKKVNYRYITFIPPETSKRIFAYLRERIHGRNLKIRPKSLDEPIFVKDYGEPMDHDTVGQNIKRVGLDSGLKKEKGAYAFWRPHAGRKYFISTIINKLKNPLLAHFMAGHKISSDDRAYWYANSDELKDFYIEALQYLSIDSVEPVKVKSPEFRKLENKYEHMELFMQAMLDDPVVYERYQNRLLQK